MSFRSQTNYHHLPRILWYAQQKRQLRFAKQAFFILFFATQYNTVEPLLKHISIIWTPLYYARFCLSQGHQLHTRIKTFKRKRGAPERRGHTRGERSPARASCNTGLIYNAQYRYQQKAAQFPSNGIVKVYKIQLECRSILSNPIKKRLQGSYGCMDEKFKTFSKNNDFIFQSQFHQIYDRLKHHESRNQSLPMMHCK